MPAPTRTAGPAIGKRHPVPHSSPSSARPPGAPAAPCGCCSTKAAARPSRSARGASPRHSGPRPARLRTRRGHHRGRRSSDWGGGGGGVPGPRWPARDRVRRGPRAAAPRRDHPLSAGLRPGQYRQPVRRLPPTRPDRPPLWLARCPTTAIATSTRASAASRRASAEPTAEPAGIFALGPRAPPVEVVPALTATSQRVPVWCNPSRHSRRACYPHMYWVGALSPSIWASPPSAGPSPDWRARLAGIFFLHPRTGAVIPQPKPLRTDSTTIGRANR